MYMSALRGKGVQVLHILGDALWEFGDRSNPPQIPEALPVVGAEESCEQEISADDEGDESEQLSGEIESLDISEGNQSSSGETGGAAADVSGSAFEPEDSEKADVEGESEEVEVEEKDPVAAMDELLNFCFACALKSKVKKSDLPLMTSHFLRNFMQPFSMGKQFDLKKSSFKKLSKFLQAKADEGYIHVKEQSKGVDVITEFDKSHSGLRDIQVPTIEEENAETGATSGGEVDTYVPLTFTDVYCVNGATQDFFKDSGYSKGDALLISEVRDCVTDYIKRNELQCEDKKTVTLDPVLAHTILKPSEGDLDKMGWEQVINRMVGKMQASVAIRVGNEPPIVKKGKLEPIKLTTAMRASNKKVTLVENLEDFGVDARVFARLVQKAVACSCSVAATDQKNKGQSVTIQGNQIAFVGKVLLEKYKIPRRYVQGLENAPKQKKR
ncbi:eukaryotic translation initiation factor 2d-like [Plakobranchus ocellatus]|uniref:Eukaryotic translation initiation factor 2d-like n=1 Tax=Plakobranchus ocellatus TaxID=259542 RepID=A0AAV4AF52_9GAST|nr:eukaryotic translation initiation factor 2d-like [Plakobranchus ocellatus]